MIDRRSFLSTGAVAAGISALPAAAVELAETSKAWVDSREKVGDLPHVWSECAGSDRAAITLRESWRHDLDRWRAETGLKRVRCHGIFADELGVWAPSIQSRKAENPNFQNVDRVYDGFVAHGIAPLVELSFMPKKLASGTSTFGFYQANITPPASIEAWASFIRAFVMHLADRYGLATVRDWPFEVWNEPNLPFFWGGKQADYFELYKATAISIKSVDPLLKIGGPATSGVAWISEFAGFCAQNNAPLDFVSTHCYAGDDQAGLFGRTAPRLPQADVICAAVAQARRQLDATPMANKPLWLTEWSSDSPAVIAHVIAGCLPHLEMMSHWAMSANYEELGVLDFLLKEGDMGYGAMVEQIAKPAFNTYKLLHALGATRVASEGPVLASRRTDGSTAALIWNLADVQAPSGIPGISRTRTVHGAHKRMTIEFRGARAGQAVAVRYVDQERGSPMPAWRAMGSPQYPKAAQLQRLRHAAEIAAPTHGRLDAKRSLTLDLPPEGVALVELR